MKFIFMTNTNNQGPKSDPIPKASFLPRRLQR